MSQHTVQYQWLPGPVGEMLRSSSLATTATVPLSGKLAITTGHVGVDLKSGKLINDSIEGEFNAVLDCVDAALRNAGAMGGLGDAHKLVAYFTRAENEKVLLRLFKQRWPLATPTLTSVVVAALVNDGMHLELQAEAHVRC